MPFAAKLFPKPKHWGLRDNELDFVAQLVPNSAGIVDGFAKAVELTPAQIATRGKPGMVVKLHGTVLPGPAGPVDGPLSGMTCAWYRSYVMTVRRTLPVAGGASLSAVPDIAPSDMRGMVHGGSELRKALRRHAEISDVPFRVGDLDGYVDIDPRVTDVDTDVFAANHVENPNRLDQCLLVEWALPLHQRVVVLGTLGPDLQLLPGPDHALLVSTKDENRIVQRHRAAEFSIMAKFHGKRVGHHGADSFNRVVRSLTVLIAVGAILTFVVLILLST